MDFAKLCEKFNLQGDFVSVKPFGGGHINGTYAVYVANAPVRRYLLQSINRALFPDAGALMRNIRFVTEHIRKKVIARGGDPNRGTLTIVPTRDGADYYCDGENNWRVYHFIEDTTAYGIPTETAMYAAGIGFGGFARDLSDFDASVLTDVLPHFHDTRMRYRAFLDAVEADEQGRVKEAADEIAYLRAHEAYAYRLPEMIESGELPLRVTFNDTKIDNILIDNATNQPTAVIDLDTVMKGSLVTDLGDAIRFGCNAASEDEPDLGKVKFRTELFSAFCRGYFTATREMLTAAELDSFVDGAITITYEQALRFLTDYLAGDTYYHTTRSGQNRDRARVQMKLMREMSERENELRAIVTAEYAAAQQMI